MDQAQMWTTRGALEVHRFLAKWTHQSILLAPTEAVARSVVCQVINTADFFAIGRQQQGKPVEPSTPCPATRAFSFKIDPPLNDLEGTWHVRSFPGDVLVNAYEPPNILPMYPADTTSLRAEGAFAVREIAAPSFVCPNHDETACTAAPDDPKPSVFYCSDETASPCTQRGYDTQLSIMDPATQRIVTFGPYLRQSKPRFQFTDRTLGVSTDQCSQQTVLPH